MYEQVTFALFAVIASVGACVLYFWGGRWLLNTAGGGLKAHRATVFKNKSYPWLFIFPAMLFLFLFLIYPVGETFWLSFHDKSGEGFVGWSNYQWAFADDGFLEAVRNNLLWLLVVPLASTVFGLVIAALADRIWWGVAAKSLIFMPMAISFIGASVIWKFVYDYRDSSQNQIGLLNAVVVYFGGEPQAWIAVPFWNNFFLMVILIWIQTGFAMVILGAALRGVPIDTIEAARLDGANAVQVFLLILVPQIMDTILVVWTTITILVLKVFDIVLAMTNGQWNTEVLANLMFNRMLGGGGDFGRGSAIAVIIMLAVLPVMAWNLRRHRAKA